MSHFSTIHARITDKNVLIQSLKDLGFVVEENVKPRTHQNNEHHAVCAVVARVDNGYDIAWDKSAGLADDEYGMLIDLWGISLKQNPQELINKINAKYAVNMALAQAAQTGISVQPVMVGVGA